MPRPEQPCEINPVAQVCVDIGPAHLDRVFEYLIPAEFDEQARVGVRVRVRFAGKDVAGWLLGRAQVPEHPGKLAYLRRVVSNEPVLSPQISVLARRVADRYAGTLPDVLRLAVPPRHARTENEDQPESPDPLPPPDPSSTAWSRYRGGDAFCQRLRAGQGPRAVWTALPGEEGWPIAIAQAAAATVLGGRGVVVVVPDTRDVDLVCAALETVGLPMWAPDRQGGTARLEASQGPTRRYRAFLAALRGRADVVVGTRAAAFAPAHDLGLVVCWDDGDDSHAEPRAPYPHIREVLATRADITGCGLLLGAYGRSVPAQALVDRGWAHALVADRAVVRASTPRVRALTSTELASHGAAASAQLPSPAFAAIRGGLAHGPVLIQVPRAGYLPVVACERCRLPATCSACHGPLGRDQADPTLRCSWCGRPATGWKCTGCNGAGLRAVMVGSRRTAEELGRAFPNIAIRVSGSGDVIPSVSDRPALVISTPGAEPLADGGYTAAVLTDAYMGALRDETETLRRWLAAASLVRSEGEVLVVGDGPPRSTQALVRWDPAWLAGLDLAERTELGLPPAVRVAALVGDPAAVALIVERVVAPELSVLGPVAIGDGEVRVLLRTSVRGGPSLTRSLAASLGVRSARHEPGEVRVKVDPTDLR